MDNNPYQYHELFSIPMASPESNGYVYSYQQSPTPSTASSEQVIVIARVCTPLALHQRTQPAFRDISLHGLEQPECKQREYITSGCCIP